MLDNRESPAAFRDALVARRGEAGARFADAAQAVIEGIEADVRQAHAPGRPADKVAALRRAQAELEELMSNDPGHGVTLRGGEALRGKLAALEVTFRSLGWLDAPPRGLGG